MPGSVRCDQDGGLSGSVHAEATPVYKSKCHTPGGGGGLLGPLPLRLQRVGLQIFYSPKGRWYGLLLAVPDYRDFLASLELFFLFEISPKIWTVRS
jgi:hypothetical protein